MVETAVVAFLLVTLAAAAIGFLFRREIVDQLCNSPTFWRIMAALFD